MNFFFKTVIVVQFILITFLILILTGVLDFNNILSLTESHLVASKNPNIITTPQKKDYKVRAINNIISNDGSKSWTSVSTAFNDPSQLSLPGKSSSLTIDLDNLRQGSPLTPGEIYSLEVNDNLWGYFPNSEDRIKQLQKIDKDISLVNYRGSIFKNSKLAKYLNLSSTIRIYVLLEFTKPVGPEVFYRLRSYGFRVIPTLKRDRYYRKHAGIFYVPFRKLKNIRNDKAVRNIFIIERYNALSKYQLGIKSSESIDSIEFKINYPYSKPGLIVSNLSYSFKSSAPIMMKHDIPEKNLLTIRTPIVKNELYFFNSRYTLKVDLLESLKRDFIVSAKGITLKEYRRKIEITSELKNIFTRQGEKIVTSDYVNNIIRQINTNMDITGIWKQITFILDKDIEYDWQKRELFFSGNLPYYNIKDMYLNVQELSEKKVGACTERTSLEIVILRELGIAARSATRVYHIFTEIYVPQKGWLSTSLILNEIPLCHSYDENMAYFIEWDKSFPIYLKWVGRVIPEVTQGLLSSSASVRR